MGVPRCTRNQVSIGGYTLPPRTTVLSNVTPCNQVESAYLDDDDDDDVDAVPAESRHAEQFRPQRWLTTTTAAEGDTPNPHIELRKLPKAFMPFGIGWCHGFSVHHTVYYVVVIQCTRFTI